MRWLQPRLWGTHVLLIIVVAACVLLGRWQWDVGHEHRAAQVERLSHEAPKPLTSVMSHNDGFPNDEMGRPVTIAGTWVDSGTLYVSQDDGGYWVITPIAVGDSKSDPAIYVVRGASSTPHAPAVSGAVSMVAWLEPDVSDLATTDTNPNDDILPQLQLSLAVPHVRQDLFSAYAVVADAQADWTATISNDGTAGLTPVPAPVPPSAAATTGLRNILYAIEWWVLAAFAIYIWYRHSYDEVHPPQDTTQPKSAEDGAVGSTV